MSGERLVYRLDVTYPENTGAGWEPDGWEDFIIDPDSPGFQWPRVHLYLSRSGAEKRATLLRSYGAEVVVVASEPIKWRGP